MEALTTAASLVTAVARIFGRKPPLLVPEETPQQVFLAYGGGPSVATPLTWKVDWTAANGTVWDARVDHCTGTLSTNEFSNGVNLIEGKSRSVVVDPAKEGPTSVKVSWLVGPPRWWRIRRTRTWVSPE